MNNIKIRKITSLTIMTIMVAGGLTVATPSFMPEAAAQSNSHLYVSASEYGGKFGGAQILEIIISDPKHSSLELANAGATGNAIGGIPQVSVDGDEIAMIQAVDGNWYAYIGDEANIEDADDLDDDSDHGLKMGIECGTAGTGSAATATGISGDDISDVDSVWVSADDCAGDGGNEDAEVLDNAPSMTSSITDNNGGRQISDNAEVSWPFIQTYPLDKWDKFDIVYENGGDTETITIKYGDSNSFAKLTTDRDYYPKGGEVHITIDDYLLNIDPTIVDVWTFNTTSGSETATYSEYVDKSTTFTDRTAMGSVNLKSIGFGDTKQGFKVTDSSSALTYQTNADCDSNGCASNIITFHETFQNSSTFDNLDDSGKYKTNLIIKEGASRGNLVVLDYNDDPQSYVVSNFTGSVVIDYDAVGAEWNSGEVLPFTFYDNDLNLKFADDEDLKISSDYTAIPTITIGEPGYLTASPWITIGRAATGNSTSLTLDTQSHIASNNDGAGTTTTVSDGGTVAEGIEIGTGILGTDFETLARTIDTDADGILSDEDRGLFIMNYDFRQISADVCGANDMDSSSYVAYYDSLNIEVRDNDTILVNLVQQAQKGEIAIEDYVTADVDNMDDGEIVVEIGCRTGTGNTYNSMNEESPFYVDFMTFAPNEVNNAVYRIEAEEAGASPDGAFEGTVEYTILNQSTADQSSDFPSRTHLSDEVVMLMTGDMTGVDAPRIKVSDTDADGVSTPQAAQMDALTHSATVSFDAENYKVADTVTVTVDDQDLNTDSSLIEVYTIAAGTDLVEDGDSTNVADGASFSHILEITFDDETWEANACTQVSGSVDDFHQTGFVLAETGIDSGVFQGTFQVPDEYCSDQTTDEFRTTTGKDMEANYIDFYDESSNTIEVGAGAAITANTGSITLDRDVYPVPFDADASGTSTDYAFLAQDGTDQDTHTATDDGDVTVYAWIDDADYDQSPTGEDQIASTAGNTIAGTACGDCGPVVIKIYRGSDYRIQATAGNDQITTNSIKSDGTTAETRNELGPITETEASSGVFELEFTLGHDNSYSQTSGTVIKQGDILTVEYTDPTDASGDSTYLATDSATFDLRTGVLTSDKSVYVIGQDVILSIIDDDLNLDSDSTETYGLDLIEWDSDAAELLLSASSNFDPEPNGLRETGSNTGVFQTVIEFPGTLSSTALDRGEVVDLEYVDYGPSGADYYNDDTEDIGLTISSSNFGATIELDQKVYSWAERVFITITAPDHNFDTALVDEIGNTADDPITVATRDTKISTYKLLETGEDTGIFYGEVTLTGFAHDADGDADTGNSSGHDRTCTASSGSGPTSGELCANDEDGITVSFEYTEDSTVIGSALIRWNIGEAQWLDSSYSAGGSGTVRIVDPDMDLHADYVDNFKVDVWSDSDSGGIDLTVTETSEMSGVFEGSVFFTTTDESSGHRLRVSEGDTVTVEYEDNTLPNPYNTADELEVAGTAIIGTITPPLERAPAANARVVDAFGNSLDEVSVDQQVQIEADLVNGTGGDQSFAYLVQVQDGNGVTVSLAWITGSLAAGQSFSPALSWIPSDAGSYEATVFVWESVDNPSALSDTVSVSIDVV